MSLGDSVAGLAPHRRFWRAVVVTLVLRCDERASRVEGASRHPLGGWGVALVAPRNEPWRTGEPVGALGGEAVNQFPETH